MNGCNDLGVAYTPPVWNAVVPVATWGQVIRAARQRHGWSGRELARRAGLSYNALSLLENNRHTPRMSTLQQIAGALDLKVSELMRDVTPPVVGGVAAAMGDENDAQAEPRTNLEGQSVKDFVYAMLQRLPEERRNDWVMELAAEVKAAEAAKRGKVASGE
jgi:transcriptional regulator with XRE-family HTH domain